MSTELTEIKVYLDAIKQASNQLNRSKKSCSFEKFIDSIKDAEKLLEEHIERTTKKIVRKGVLKYV